MLDKVIMLSFTIFMIFLFSLMAVTGLAMFTQWGMVQNEAQMIASVMGKWGGYTADADRAVSDFAGQLKLQRSQVTVQVRSSGPDPWGTPVWAKISVPFKFRVGRYDVGTFSLTGYGKSVSTYLPGAYSVQYTRP